MPDHFPDGDDDEYIPWDCDNQGPQDLYFELDESEDD